MSTHQAALLAGMALLAIMAGCRNTGWPCSTDPNVNVPPPVAPGSTGVYAGSPYANPNPYARPPNPPSLRGPSLSTGTNLPPTLPPTLPSNPYGLPPAVTGPTGPVLQTVPPANGVTAPPLIPSNGTNGSEQVIDPNRLPPTDYDVLPPSGHDFATGGGIG